MKSLVSEFNYPGDLPVVQRREDIAKLIAGNQVVIIAGETGSGKTTQLPKICMELGFGREKQIGHTQPRRLAARTVAERIAAELGQSLGESIGYQVRFHENVSTNTSVKLMTDGILLSELRRDPNLERYDVLIIDEAHERSLNIDFVLGYLSRLLKTRSDLKLIVTSATIDVDRFSKFFDDAPVLEVSGRSYPVEVHYLAEGGESERDFVRDAANAVRDVAAGKFGSPGDVLVFLAGERDIREMARNLRHEKNLNVRPLYARLSQREQARVFADDKTPGLRVVLSTNVAETSVTVPGIRYVVDTGVARISRYSFRSGFQRLPIEAISQASANQRMGRCGRVGPGVCLRLYSEDDFNSRAEFTDAEIRRSNLAAVVLRMLQLRLGEVERFPFLDRPDSRLVKDAYRRLWELGATNPQQHLSKLGRRMAAFPIDPGFARMILAAEREGVVAEVLIVASALSIQDPRERPTDRQAQADQSHARFRDPRSDFVSLILLWRYYEEQRQTLSENQLRKLCRREFLSWLRMREWRDVHRQLVISCRQQGLKVAATATTNHAEGGEATPGASIHYDRIHRAILTGLISNIAQQDERREYRAARNRGLVLFPGSALYKKPPKWLVAGEIVETEKVYARTAAVIQPDWLLTANPKLLKHSYYEPRWEKRSGRVVAWRRSTLFGLTVSDRVAIHYAKEDPVLCRELLIREGLIAGSWHAPPPFLKHNLKLCRSVEDLESRLRRRDVLRDDQAMFELYDQRLPENVVSAISLQDALKKQPTLDAKLRFRRDEIVTRDPGNIEDQFPSELRWDGISYRLRYEFSPNSSADGVSIRTPIALLNRLPRQRLEWLVPGLLREKCIAMVKGLPKAVRRQLVPVPDWVDRALIQLTPDNTSLSGALARVFSELGSVRLTARDFEGVTLDDYYQMNLQILDDQGRLLAEGRDIDALIERFAEKTRASLRSGAGDSPARSGLQRWDFGDLANTYDTRRAGTALRAYPALVDQQDAVEIGLFDYPAQAHIAHRSGVARLLMLQSKPLFRDLRKRLLKGNTVMLQMARLGLDREELISGLLMAIALEAAGPGSSRCRAQKAFETYSASVSRAAVSIANEFERYLLQGLTHWDSSVARSGDRAYAVAIADLQEERGRLLATAELAASSADELRHYPRYAKAAEIRAERLAGNFRRDQECQARLSALHEPLADLQRKVPLLGLVSTSAREYEIMLREFRVSLFSQHLGTSRPVSEKRLKNHWHVVESWYKETRGQVPEA